MPESMELPKTWQSFNTNAFRCSEVFGQNDELGGPGDFILENRSRAEPNGEGGLVRPLDSEEQGQGGKPAKPRIS